MSLWIRGPNLGSLGWKTSPEVFLVGDKVRDGAQSCQWVSPAMLDGLGQAARRDTAVPARLLRPARGWQRWLPEAMFRWQVLDGDASTFKVVTQ